MSWAKQDCLGKTDAEIVGGEEGARLIAFKREVLRTGRGARTEAEVTVEGEKFYFDLVAEPLCDANGTIVGLTCSATDITSAKKNLLERERLIAQLQEALEEVKLLERTAFHLCFLQENHERTQRLGALGELHPIALGSEVLPWRVSRLFTKTISRITIRRNRFAIATQESLCPVHVSQASCVRTR